MITDPVYPPITNTVTAFLMLPSGRGLGSKDISPVPSRFEARGSYVHTSAKCPCEDSDPESDSENKDNTEADTMEQMDFQTTATQHITSTQVLGDANDNPGYLGSELPPPLTPEHVALHTDFQMITGLAMDRLYERFNATLGKTTSQLQGQILSLNARVSTLQGQLLACHATTQHTAAKMMADPLPAKKDPKRKTEKPNTNQTASNPTANNGPTYAMVASTITLSPTPALSHTDTRGWTTLKVEGGKKTTTPKLIPTIYLKAEREVSCYFATDETNTAPSEQDHTMRQAAVDAALCRVNSAFIDTKDVDVPPFIRVRVTTRSAIIFTTSNCQSNIIYEDYVTIIADAL